MNWFNLYRKTKLIKDAETGEESIKYDFDKAQWLEDQKELEYIESNKGKFVAAVDDKDDKPLTDKELEELEEMRNNPVIPTIVEAYENPKKNRNDFSKKEQVKLRKKALEYAEQKEKEKKEREAQKKKEEEQKLEEENQEVKKKKDEHNR